MNEEEFNEIKEDFEKAKKLQPDVPELRLIQQIGDIYDMDSDWLAGLLKKEDALGNVEEFITKKFNSKSMEAKGRVNVDTGKVMRDDGKTPEQRSNAAKKSWAKRKRKGHRQLEDHVDKPVSYYHDQERDMLFGVMMSAHWAKKDIKDQSWHLKTYDKFQQDMKKEGHPFYDSYKERERLEKEKLPIEAELENIKKYRKTLLDVKKHKVGVTHVQGDRWEKQYKIDKPIVEELERKLKPIKDAYNKVSQKISNANMDHVVKEIEKGGYTEDEMQEEKYIPNDNVEREDRWNKAHPDAQHHSDAEKSNMFYKSENGKYYFVKGIRFNENAIDKNEPAFSIDMSDKDGNYVNSLFAWSSAEINDIAKKGLLMNVVNYTGKDKSWVDANPEK